MRYVIAGLVLIAAGIAFTEYARRNPGSTEASGTQKKGPRVPTTPPTMKALIEAQPGEPVAAESTEAAQAEVAALVPETAASEQGFEVLLRGAFSARELRGGAGGSAVFVYEKGGRQALVRVGPGQAPKVLAVRKDVITAVAADGPTLLWAEGSRAFSMALEGGPITQVVRLDKALITSLAAKGGLVLAALIPRDLDPFSTDPSGAVVRLEGGAATLVAGEQIRPHDVLTDGKDVFFVAGYPSGLVRAALDGSFSSRIAERADGPLALDGEGIVYRYPLTSAPEVRRSALAGGSTRSLAHFDADWLTAAAGVTRFTTVGIGARLYEVSGGGEPAELLTLAGAAKGLTTGGSTLFLATADDRGETLLQARP